jgi:hypothetical protein
MLSYLIDYSLEDLIERYNKTTGKKDIKHFSTLPTERDGTIQIAFIILFTVDEQTSPTAADTPKVKRVLGGYIIPT